jgi:hypothetical protein
VGAGSGLVARHALAHIFEDRAQERGRFSIEHWRSPPAKAAFCLNPVSRGFTQVTVNEKFCAMTGKNERGPAFLGLGGLMAEPRGPCICAGPPPNPAEPVPWLDIKTARSSNA